MLNFCDFIQVYIFTTNHHLNPFNSFQYSFAFLNVLILAFRFVVYHVHTFCFLSMTYSLLELIKFFCLFPIFLFYNYCGIYKILSVNLYIPSHTILVSLYMF